MRDPSSETIEDCARKLFKDGSVTARAADGRLYSDLDEDGVPAFLHEAGFVDVETWRTVSTLDGIDTT